MNKKGKVVIYTLHLLCADPLSSLDSTPPASLFSAAPEINFKVSLLKIEDEVKGHHHYKDINEKVYESQSNLNTPFGCVPAHISLVLAKFHRINGAHPRWRDFLVSGLTISVVNLDLKTDEQLKDYSLTYALLRDLREGGSDKIRLTPKETLTPYRTGNAKMGYTYKWINRFTLNASREHYPWFTPFKTGHQELVSQTLDFYQTIVPFSQEIKTDILNFVFEHN